jgi:hypothetical protein
VNDDDVPQFPQYDPPTGIPVASRKQAAPLQKIIGRMFKGRARTTRSTGKKGLQSNQNVHINHKKVKFY